MKEKIKKTVMNTEFKKIVDTFPGLIYQLVNSPARHWNNLDNLPQKGIYVFFEDEHSLYVGRTRVMKNRIKQHGNRNLGHNSAPFAFNLAKKGAKEKGININMNRTDLEKNSEFLNLFLQAKERVSRMMFRFIEIKDPITQSLC